MSRYLPLSVSRTVVWPEVEQLDRAGLAPDGERVAADAGAGRKTIRTGSVQNSHRRAHRTRVPFAIPASIPVHIAAIVVPVPSPSVHDDAVGGRDGDQRAGQHAPLLDGLPAHAADRRGGLGPIHREVRGDHANALHLRDLRPNVLEIPDG